MKKIISLLLCMILLFALFSCDVPQNGNNKGNDNQTNVDKSDSDQSSSDNRNDQEDETNNVEDSKQTPVYEGMTVSSLTENADNASLQTISYVRNKSAYMRTGAKAKEPNIYDFYADLGEDLLLYIHINNPDSFEILSFTINGDKYSSYMFEYGSDLETIIIKCNVGNESGVKTFTIDAIKYIDKQAIKDVIIHGEKTISIHISTDQYVELCEHNESGWIEDKEATKTEDGSRHTECTKCGKTMNEEVVYATGSIGIVYYESAKGYVVGGIGGCLDADVIIPKYHNGLSVVGIAEGAFSGCKTFVSIEIPDSVTSIGNSAFSNCYSLSKVTILGSLTEIGASAFRSCSSLTDITLPDSVAKIGTTAFMDCSSLLSINIPSSMTTISRSTFNNCRSLKNVTISNNVAVVENDAFYSCYSLENVYYSGALEDWCNIQFADNDANPAYHANNLYINNEIITEVVVPDGITRIHRTFHGWKWLVEVIIPNCVTEIGEYAFSDTSIENVVIPQNVVKIGEHAFSYCSALKSIVIPNSVTRIDDLAFYNSKSMISITYEGGIDQWEAIVKESKWDYGSGKYTIYCTDGEIAKDGTVTYYESAEGLDYPLDDDGKSYSVSESGTCTDTDVVISSTYNALPVASIADGVLFYCKKQGDYTICVANCVTPLQKTA